DPPDARAAAPPRGRRSARLTQPRRPAREDRARRQDGARPVAQPVLLRTRELAEGPREGGNQEDGIVPESARPPGRVREDAFDDPLHHGLLAPRGDEREDAAEARAADRSRSELAEEALRALG